MKCADDPAYDHLRAFYHYEVLCAKMTCHVVSWNQPRTLHQVRTSRRERGDYPHEVHHHQLGADIAIPFIVRSYQRADHRLRAG